MSQAPIAPESQNDLAEAWDRVIQYLMGLSPEARAEALANPGEVLDDAGLGDVDGPALQQAITNSGSFNREYNVGNTSGSGGGAGHVAPPPPPHCEPLPGETHHEAAERVMNYYINNTYTSFVDQSTNIGGNNYGDISNRQVAGDHNQTGDGSTFGDNLDIDGDGAVVTTGDGNQVAPGDGNVLVGDNNDLDDITTGDGNAVGDRSAVGNGNATGDGAVALGGGSVGGNLNTGSGAQVGDGSAFGAGSSVGNSGVTGHGNTTGFGNGTTIGGDVSADRGGAVSVGDGASTGHYEDNDQDNDGVDNDNSHNQDNDTTNSHNQDNDQDNDTTNSHNQDNDQDNDTTNVDAEVDVSVI